MAVTRRNPERCAAYRELGDRSRPATFGRRPLIGTSDSIRQVRLPTRALNAEAAQRAFKLRYSCSDALEVLTREREEPHRRTRHDSGRSLTGQEECDLAERVAGAESVRRLATVGEAIGLSLFDEVEGGSVVVERDDLGTGLNLDLTHCGRKLAELGCWQIG